jgi:hypothetical protein
MQVDLDVFLKILAPLLTTAVGIVVRDRLTSKPRLIYSLVHASDHPLGQPAQPGAQGAAPQVPQIQWIRTHSILIRNAGRQAAKNLRVGHMIKPPSIQVFPPVFHEIVSTTPNADGPFEIVIPSLAPKETVTIAYLYTNTTAQQIGATVKSDEGLGQRVDAVVNAPWPAFLPPLVWTLLFVGGCTAIYWCLRAAAWFLQISS